MRYLVTGSAGFLGYHLAMSLADETDAVVHCVDNGVRGEADALYAQLVSRPNVTSWELDLNDSGLVSSLPEVDIVFHLAALNGTQNFYERPFDVMLNCTLPTVNLLLRYKSAALTRFVYAGTSEAYASTVTRFNWEVPTGEDVPLGIDDVTNVRWSYAGSKMHGEVATIAAHEQYGVPYSIIRYHNAYGPRMGDKHVVPDFFGRAKNGRYELFGFEDTRSFIYVDDAITATRAIATAAGAENQIVNIGGDREITILELGNKMMQVGGFDGQMTLHQSPAGSVRRRRPKLDKLRSITSFVERWSLEDGLRETAKYYLRKDS